MRTRKGYAIACKLEKKASAFRNRPIIKVLLLGGQGFRARQEEIKTGQECFALVMHRTGSRFFCHFLTERGHVDHIAKAHLAFFYALERGIHVLDRDQLDLRRNPVLCAEIENLLGFLDRADQRVCVA